MNRRSTHNILDVLLIILNLSTTYSFLPYLLFTSKMGINALIVSITTLIYLIFRFRKPFKPRGSVFLFIIYISLMFVNAAFGLYTKTYSIGLSVLLFQNILFYYLLQNVFYNSHSNENVDFNIKVSSITRGYNLYICYSLFVILLLFFLIIIFNLSPFNNPVNEKAELFLSNIETGYGASNYFFPYYISVFYESSDIRIPFFQKDGFITGFFHEPHVVGLLSTPAVIFSLGESIPLRRKKIICISLLLVCCISASTVNIISILITVLVFFLVKYKKRMVYAFLIIPVLLFVIYRMSSLAVFDFIFSKFASESFIDTITRLTFAFTPKTILGSNFITYDMFNSYGGEDVGYIVCFLNVTFLLSCYYKIYYILFKSQYVFIGLGIFYFFLHSVKIGMPTLSLSFLVFVFFILDKCYEKSRIERISMKQR